MERQKKRPTRGSGGASDSGPSKAHRPGAGTSPAPGNVQEETWRSKPTAMWDGPEVADWLTASGLACLVPAFETNGIDGSALYVLKPGHLVALGVTTRIRESALWDAALGKLGIVLDSASNTATEQSKSPRAPSPVVAIRTRLTTLVEEGEGSDAASEITNQQATQRTTNPRRSRKKRSPRWNPRNPRRRATTTIRNA